MNIGKEDLLRINHGFGGDLRDDSSLDFALERMKSKKLGSYKKMAYLIRAIIVDHPFSDGNKRTAGYFSLKMANKIGKKVDMDLLTHHLVSIAKHNVHDIRKIERRLKNAIK